VAGPSAHAGFIPGGDTPAACAHGLFRDVVATPGGDVVTGGALPQRIYGLTGNDWLIGSGTRASCLFGGRGDDALSLGTGGGIALGEVGNDVLTGSWRSDSLFGGEGDDSLTGMEGADVMLGDEGTDLLDGGAGDDIVDARDGRPEIVNCGPGTADTAVADGVDVRLACESSQLAGRALRSKAVHRSSSGAARLRFTVPQAAGAGEWRVLLLDCEGRLHEAARLPAVRRGQLKRIRLEPPAGGWCAGRQTGAIVRAQPCRAAAACSGPPPPPLPVAYLRF
jgi:hypothetical protein